MRLHDPLFSKIGGEPVTGMIPPLLQVYGELTPGQASEVAHHYKLFRDALKVSLTAYFVQNRTLADGSKVRMVSSNGRDTVYVWPVGGSNEVLYVLRGFVVAPLPVSGTQVAKLDRPILAFLNDALKWDKFQAPYPLGEKRQALNYTVSTTAWTGRQAASPRAGYTLWANKKAHNVQAVGDAKFNDVFAIKGSTLYRNAVKLKGLSVAPAGAPVVLMAGAEYIPVFVSDNQVAGVVDKAVSVAYDWPTYFAPIASGITFQSGAAVLSGPKASYIGYNKLSTEAVQIWTATVPLAASYPFIGTPIEEFVQLDPPASLNSNDTFVTTDIALEPGPIYNSMSLAAGFLWGGTDVVYMGPLYSGTPIYSGSAQQLDFDKHYAESDTFNINDVEVATIDRHVDITSRMTVNSTQTERTCPVAVIYAYPPPDCEYGMFPADFGGINTVSGDPMGPAVNYSSSTVDHVDTSLCDVAVPGLTDSIWKVAVTHTTVGDQKDSIEHPPDYAPDGYLSGHPANRKAPNTYTLVTSPGRASEEHSSFERTDTHSLDGAARDFFYADRTNGVFGWIETTITSTSTKVPDTAATGTSSITVKLKFTAPGVTFERTLFTRDFGTPITLSLQVPWGINFSGSLLAFSYHAPPRPAPIFAPLWQEQGLCPSIAYTVVDEPGTRTAAFFRLQMMRTDLPPGYEPPIFPGTTAFRPYLFEQMVADYGAAWGTGASDALDAVFGAPIILHVASPDATLFDNVFDPLDDTTQYADIYRT